MRLHCCRTSRPPLVSRRHGGGLMSRTPPAVPHVTAQPLGTAGAASSCGVARVAVYASSAAHRRSVAANGAAAAAASGGCTPGLSPVAPGPCLCLLGSVAAAPSSIATAAATAVLPASSGLFPPHAPPPPPPPLLRRTQHQRALFTSRRRAAVVAACLGGGGGGGGARESGGGAFGGAKWRHRNRRSSGKPDAAAPLAGSGGVGGGVAPGGGGASAGPSPSPVSSPVPPPSPGVGGGGGGSVATAAAASAAVVVTAREAPAAASEGRTGDSGGESDYEALGGSHIVPFARRQPRALVLDCAYRPINVLTWYKAFHFDYFGKGEVLEYYPPPAVCTTGSGEHPLPAVLRVPQYTADMQDLCSRVACSRRNVMVRDGFCCQYCGARRDLTIDHVVPVSRGGKDAWDNLVTACMRCNQRKSDRSLRELGWKLRRQPREPTPYEIGIVAGIATSDILRPPPEWEAYIAPYRERLETYRRAAVEAGLLNMMDDD